MTPIEQLQRIDFNSELPPGHLSVTGDRRLLPTGSTLRGGVFYWQAGPGFLGEYELLFERPEGGPVRVRVMIQPKGYAGKTAVNRITFKF